MENFHPFIWRLQIEEQQQCERVVSLLFHNLWSLNAAHQNNNIKHSYFDFPLIPDDYPMSGYVEGKKIHLKSIQTNSLLSLTT